MDELITNPSDRTLSERAKFASLIDDFATFQWDGKNMWDNFGAFIINNKGSLKIYNGASFKNTYTQTQYQDGYSNIVGITFDHQQITFTIGVYWISIEDYRILINFLHPYKVAMLSFGFEETYGYECKLSTIKDSTRYVVGKEISNNENVENNETQHLKYSRLPANNEQNGYRYYTELQLTFDVVGKQCAKEIAPYRITSQFEGWSTPHYIQSWSPYTSVENLQKFWLSDLDYPFKLTMPSWYSFKRNDQQQPMHLQGIAHITVDGVDYSTLLFEIQLKNLLAAPNTAYTGTDPVTYITLQYDSEQGLLYWQNGDKQQILSLLSVGADGQRIVDYLKVQRFMWPGQLDHSETTRVTSAYIEILDINSNTYFLKNSGIGLIYESRRRTNVI